MIRATADAVVFLLLKPFIIEYKRAAFSQTTRFTVFNIISYRLPLHYPAPRWLPLML